MGRGKKVGSETAARGRANGLPGWSILLRGTVFREAISAVAGVVYRLCARRGAGARLGRTVESVSWGVCKGRHRAGTYGDLMGLAGRGLAGHLRLGTCYEYRHPVDEARHGLGGALRGRSPRTREGRIGPTAQNCSGQWRRFLWRRSERGQVLVRALPEDCESSPPSWDAPNPRCRVDIATMYILLYK